MESTQPSFPKPFTETELFLDEVLVHLKYDALCLENESLLDEPEKEILEEHQLGDKLAGLVDVDKSEVLTSVKSWMKEIDRAIPESSLSFGKLMKKRKLVQKALVRNLLETESNSEDSGCVPVISPSVPVVVRLGILTIFPLIRSLSKMKDFDFDEMCSSTLEILLSVLENLPPLSLYQEPEDCFDAFSNFIYDLIRKRNFKITTEMAHKSIVALTALTVTRGGSKNLFQLMDCFFEISKAHPEASLQIGSYLNRIASVGVTNDSQMELEVPDVTPMQALGSLRESLEKLCQPHKVYTSAPILDFSGSFQNPTDIPNFFTVDDSPNFFKEIASCMKHCLAGLEGDGNQAEAIRFLVFFFRITKLNLHYLMNQNPETKNRFKRYLISQFSHMRDIREILTLFVFGRFSASQSEDIQNLRKEAIHTITAGFFVFYQHKNEAIILLIDLLKQPSATCHNQLLESVFPQLASWKFSAQILTEKPFFAEMTLKSKKETSVSEVPKPIEALPQKKGLLPRARRQKVEKQPETKKHAEKPQLPKEVIQPESPSPFASDFLGLIIDKLASEVIQHLSGGSSEPSTTVSFLVSLQRGILSKRFGSEFVVQYLSILFQKCGQLIDRILESSIFFDAFERGLTSEEAFLRKTFLGVVIGSAIPTLARKRITHDLAINSAIVEPTISLCQKFDLLNSKLKTSEAAIQSYLATSPERQVLQRYIIESEHPYPKIQYKEAIKIPGASSITIHFDLKCSTSHSSDVVGIVGTGPKDSHFYSENNFPKGPIVISGDSFNFSFSSGSRKELTSTNPEQRWGFRLLATRTLSQETKSLIPSWILDIETSLSWFVSKCCSQLINGPIPGQLAKFQLEETGIFVGGLQLNNQSEETIFLNNFTLGEGTLAQAFWAHLLSLSHARLRSNPIVEKVERTFWAVLLKHLGLLQEAIQFSKDLVSHAPLLESSKLRWKSLSEQIRQVSTFVSQRAQWEKQWQNAITECVSSQSTISEQLKEINENGNLKNICEIKNISITPHQDEKEIVELLEARLQAEVEEAKKGNDYKEQNATELIARPVLEKLEFLLFKIAPAVESIDSGSLWKNDGSCRKLYQTSYHSWKIWSLESHDIHLNPIRGITTFLKSTVNCNDIISHLELQKTRGNLRSLGFEQFSKLLRITSKAPILHQILGSIQFQSKHYLADLSSCGRAIGEKVTTSFSSLLQRIVEIFRDATIDSTSRSLALRITALLFEEFDAPLLQNAQIFPALRDIIAEDLRDVPSVAPTPIPVVHLQTSVSEVDDEESESSESSSEGSGDDAKEPPRLPQAPIKEEKVLSKPTRITLRFLAWTSFRLLAMLGIHWSQSIDGSVFPLQNQIFEIMCSELGRLSKLDKDSEKEKETQDQCFELLSLIFSLGGNPEQMKFLAGAKNLDNLLSMLVPGVAPKSQRLVLRLFRKLLPETSAPIEGITNNLFENIGGLLLMGTPSSNLQREPSIMDLEKLDTGKADTSNPDKEHCVNLLRWDLGDKKLAEVCLSTLGNAFSETRNTSEVRAASLLLTLNSSGSVTLTNGPQGQCKRLAQAIAAAGGTSLVQVYDQIQSEKNQNMNEENQRKWPVFWIDGQTASGLASEHIALLRILIDSNKWRDQILSQIQGHLEFLPKLLGSIETSIKVHKNMLSQSLACLAVLGSFIEVIRIGGHVSVNLFGETKQGTVISNSMTNSQILLPCQTSEKNIIEKINNKSLLACSEITVDPRIYDPFARSLINSIIRAIESFPTVAQLTPSLQITALEIRNSCFGVLEFLAKDQQFADMIFENLSPQLLQEIFTMAKTVGPSLPTRSLFQKYSDIREKVWNVLNNPVLKETTLNNSMAQILPFCPFSSKCSVLPTGFEVAKQNGLIFFDEDRRIVECVNLIAPNIGMRSRGFGFGGSARKISEILVLANLAAPLHLNYYFEVHIREASAASHISVGFSPENATQWDYGSYRFQANKTKTWYPSNGKDPKHVPYGVPFKKDDVVGCGWNAETKAIYFTKNGATLQVAWSLTPSSNLKLVPAVGLSKGVQLKINFGQEKFMYQLESELSPTLLAQQQKEALETQLAEQNEEDRKREEQQNLLLAKRTADAQDIGVMFDIQVERVLKAMEIIGYDGNKEVLVSWLLDHPEFIAIKEEPKKEPVLPQKEEAPTPGTEIQAEAPLINKTKLSSQFWLSSGLSFKQSSSPSAVSLLESQIAPIVNDMRTIMLRDARQSYEIENAVMQFTQAIQGGQIHEALRLFEHLCGSPTQNVVSFLQKKTHTFASNLKIDEVQIGNCLKVQETNQDFLNRNNLFFVPEMNHLQEKVGVVKSINHKNLSVLLSFYEPENGELSEWWFPVSALIKSEKHASPIPRESLQVLQKDLVQACTYLSQHYTRSLLLNVLNSSSSNLNTLEQSAPLFFGNFLDLGLLSFASDSRSITRTGLWTDLLFDDGLLKAKNGEPSFVNLCHSLVNCYQMLSTEEKASFTSQLLTTIQESAKAVENLQKTTLTVEVDRNKLGSREEVKLDDCSECLIVFEKSTSLPPKSELGFYHDKECSKSIKVVDQDNLNSMIVPTNHFFHQLLNKSETFPTNKYHFIVIPLSVQLVKLRFGIEFLVEFCLDSLNMSHIVSLYLQILNLLNSSFPSILSEGLFILLTHLTHKLRNKFHDPNSIVSLEPVRQKFQLLKQEMIALQDSQSKKLNGLLPSYLQNLIQCVLIFEVEIPTQPKHAEEDILLMVAMALMERIHKVEQTIGGESKKLAPEPPKENPGIIQGIMGMIRKTLENPPEAEDQKSDQMEEDDEFAQALRLSLGSEKSPARIPQSTEPEPQAESPQWFEEMKELANLLFFFQWENSPIEDRSEDTEVFVPLIKKAQQEIRKEPLQERFLLVKNIPQVLSKHANSLNNILTNKFKESLTLVPNGVFIPIHEDSMLTKDWCIIELSSLSMVRQFLSKPPTITIPAFLNSELESNKEKGALTVLTFQKCPEFEEFLTSIFLARKDSMNVEGSQAETEFDLTSKFQTAISSIFLQFGCDGIFSSKSFQALRDITGTDFNVEAILTEFPSFVDTRDTIKGLTSDGLAALFKKRAQNDPFQLLEQFIHLGYDTDLSLHTYPFLKETQEFILSNKLQFKNLKQLNQELVFRAEQIFSEAHHLDSIFPLSSTTIKEIPPTSSLALEFPSLVSIPPHYLRIKFQLLKLFNIHLTKYFEYLNLERSGIMSKLLFEFKGLIFNSVKMDFFFSMLDQTAVDSNVIPQPKVTINRLKLAENKSADDFVKHTSFGIAFEQLRHTSPAAFRQKKPKDTSPHFSLKIEFQGENVQGDGGPYRQFFTDVSNELRSSSLLLRKCPNALSGVGNNQDKYILVPSTKSRSQLRMLRFLGQLMGMAIRTGVLLTLDLTDFVWKPLTGDDVTVQELKAVDLSTIQNFDKLLNDPSEIESYEPNTPVLLSDGTKKQITDSIGKPILLTNETKEEWVKQAIQTRVNEAKVALTAVRQGLTDIIPAHLLEICTAKDLQERVSGKPFIDIELLKRHTEYSGVDPNAHHILDFWQVLESFNQEERRAFIQFTWAQERLPTSDQEFTRTSSRMLIKPFMGTTDPDRAFPKADTCFFNLSLPEYSSAEILRKQLLYAIRTDAHSMNADAPENEGRRPFGGASFFGL